MTHKRLYELDAIRVLACFLVCVCHAPLPNTSGESSLWLSAYNYISCTSIGLFFMVSGALLFPIEINVTTFIKRRFIRILLPAMFWSIVTLVTFSALGKISPIETLKSLFLLPLKPVHGVYWFIYTILGLYLAAPIISPALRNEKLVRYYLILWGATLILPYLNAIIPNYWLFSGNLYHPLHEFSGFMGYMVLGYYLRHHIPSIFHFFIRFFIPGLLIATIVPLYFMCFPHPEIPHSILYGYLTINIAVMCSLLFIALHLIFKYIPILESHNILVDVSSKTFGIYLIHILIMRELLWNVWESLFPDIGYAIQIPSVAIVTFILSYFIIKLISFIPGSKYII